MPIRFDHVLIFTLVLTRISGLMVSAPLFGAIEVPARIRAFLAIAAALVLTPAQLDTPIRLPQSPIDYLLLVGAEVLIGMALGFGVTILFSGVQLAGQLISQSGGMSLAEVFNPSADTNLPLMSELLHWFALAVFLTIGGHRTLMEGLLSTFAAIPPAQGGISASLGEAFHTLVTESMSLAVRAAAPAITALLVATVVLGLVGRTIPQLNVMALGFGVNAAVTLLTVWISLGAIAWLFQEQVEPFVETIVRALGVG